jgi:hypothetical protein
MHARLRKRGFSLVHSDNTASGAASIGGSFAAEYSGRGVKLITLLHLLPRS